MAQRSGTAYSDVIGGTGESDTIWGWDGNDSLYGYAGNDMLYGGMGNDYLNGGIGIDTVVGHDGADYLVGGNDYSTDYFRFWQGDSLSANGYSDTIADWNVSYDYIDVPLAATSSTYAETSTTANNIATARSVVHGNSWLAAKDHVFLYNAATDTGYLLSDLDRNWVFETGVVIQGAGSAYDMSWSDIV